MHLSHTLRKFSTRVPRRIRVKKPAQNHQYPQQQQASLPFSLRQAAIAYFTLVNVSAFGLFAYDKYQAQNRGWRVSERNLQLSALVGGWLGGITAMSLTRHKTKKKSFQTPYFTCVAVNALASAGAIAGWRYSPMFRQALVSRISMQPK